MFINVAGPDKLGYLVSNHKNTSSYAENIWKIGEVRQNCKRANAVSIKKKRKNRNKKL